MGAVTANWGNVPPVLADRPWPALKHTGTCLPSAFVNLLSTNVRKERTAGEQLINCMVDNLVISPGV